jgi:hypothetical protein
LTLAEDAPPTNADQTLRTKASQLPLLYKAVQVLNRKNKKIVSELQSIECLIDDEEAPGRFSTEEERLLYRHFQKITKVLRIARAQCSEQCVVLELRSLVFQNVPDFLDRSQTKNCSWNSTERS